MLALVLGLVGLSACQLSYTGGARPVQPSQIGTDWYRAASTPVVRQHHETDCGLAALAMVAGAWGRQWSVDDLNHQLPPNERGIKLGVRDKDTGEYPDGPAHLMGQPAPASIDAAMAPLEGPLAALVTAQDPPDASVVFTSLVDHR